MLFGKKKKISEYLSEKQASQVVTAFDFMLSEYLSGCLKEKLCKLNMRRIDIHIDWLTDYKCINIQGKVVDYYFDIQIEPSFFLIAYDKDEPENVMEFTLEGVTEFYEILEKEIIKIK